MTPGEVTFAWVVGIAVLVLVIYFVFRPSDQAQVSPGDIPVTSDAYESASYVDCSLVNTLTYDSRNPCEAFVRITGGGDRSALALLRAEISTLRVEGWAHARSIPVDFDGDGSGMTPASETWRAPGTLTCAYVTTLQAGVASEHAALTPYDAYDVPQGVYSFYRSARAADPARSLWVRLSPGHSKGQAMC